MVGLSGWFSWLIAANAAPAEVTSPVMTVIISMIFSYIITSVMLSFVSFSSETIMIAYLISKDLEKISQNNKKFMNFKIVEEPEGLRQFFEKKNSVKNTV